MNISSILPLRNKYIHIVYISIIASLLLVATVGPSLLQAAAQEGNEVQLATLCTHYGEGVVINRGGRTESISFGEWLIVEHSELVDLFNQVGCSGISAAVTGGIVRGETTLRSFSGANIVERFIDLDGDGEDDLRIRARTFLQDLTGILEGQSVAQSIVRRDLQALTTSQAITVVFSGTVGDSEPGTMTWINTVVADLSDPDNFTFKGRIVVIEGSGHDGLEGICGGGTTLGQGPAGGPFSAESDFAFAFGESCQNFNPFN